MVQYKKVAAENDCLATEDEERAAQNDNAAAENDCRAAEDEERAAQNDDRDAQANGREAVTTKKEKMKRNSWTAL